MRGRGTSPAWPTPNVTDWQYLNLNYVAKARIDQDLCIKCGRCHIGLRGHLAPGDHGDEGRGAPFRGDRRRVRRLQSLRQRMPRRGMHHHEKLPAGTVDPRTGRTVPAEYGNWTQHPNNPSAVAAE